MKKEKKDHHSSAGSTLKTQHDYHSHLFRNIFFL
jgi:hypothetical protein